MIPVVSLGFPLCSGAFSRDNDTKLACACYFHSFLHDERFLKDSLQNSRNTRQIKLAIGGNLEQTLQNQRKTGFDIAEFS